MIMSRQNQGGQNFLPGKIRKRGCSSSASSTSSIVQNYRFKRAILIGKRGGGSTTPVPTWRLMRTPSSASALRAVESQSESGFVSKVKQHQQQLQQPVSARKLAATLWEMNEMPSPKVNESSGGYDERRMRREIRARERERERERITRSFHSGSLPPQLSDPSHSPGSERMDRSGTGSRHRRSSSISQRLRLIAEHNGGILDSASNASLMEIGAKSRAQTPSGSIVGLKTRLKDVSNALTTSKELLKIINRMWSQEDRPSSSMSLISALHAELERARLQVNQVIQEQCSDQNEINYLMKCFAEEKAAWKNKEQEVVEAAIESTAGELEVERRLRKRFESLNKKLGKELAVIKASFLKAVKDLETEKRARVIIKQVCDKLARDISDDKAEVEELERESAIVREEVEKEREMMQLAEVLREERAQLKLSETKYQLEEKNAAVDKLRSQLDVFLGNKKAKEKWRGPVNQLSNEEISAYLSRSHFGSHRNEENDDDEVDGVECEDDSAESDLHSIELNMDNSNKSYKWAFAPGAACDSRKGPFDEEEITGRKSTSGKAPRRSTSLQRSISDGVDWGATQAERFQNGGDDMHWGRLAELDKQAQVLGYADEMHGYKSAKGLRDQFLSTSSVGASRVYASPTRPSRDHGNTAQELPPVVPGTVSKSRLGESRGEIQNARKSRW